MSIVPKILRRLSFEAVTLNQHYYHQQNKKHKTEAFFRRLQRNLELDTNTYDKNRFYEREWNRNNRNLI